MKGPLVTILSAAVLLTACAADTGPTELSDVCDAYKKFQSQYTGVHILSNEKVFSTLSELGDIATRYPGSTSISAAGPRLKRMGKSDSLNMGELELTISPIKFSCRKSGN